MVQKFFAGDLVRIADDLGPSMSHFTSGCEAVVIYSYAEHYGETRGRYTKMYCLYLPNEGESSWYEEEQLTFIEPDRFDKLPKNHVARQVYEAKLARDTSYNGFIDVGGMTYDEVRFASRGE